MRTQVVSFDVLRGKHTSALGEDAANRSQRERMVQVLTAAMGQELTPRQKQCMELCVLRGMSQVEAGRLLGLNKSTVCRHIQKGDLRLETGSGICRHGRTPLPGGLTCSAPPWSRKKRGASASH